MTLKKKKKISIVIPVYNEVKSLRAILEKVRKAPVMGFEKEILVVDDASTDGSWELLTSLKWRNLKIYRHERNKGKGAALRTAFPHTTGDIVLIQDADLEYDPKDYEKLLAPILENAADVVYGSRFLGMHRAFLFWHYVGNKFLTFLTNLLYDSILTDMETCYKVFRGEVIRSLPLRSNRFDIEPEITAKVLKRGYRLYEVPISYQGRGYEEGKKISWRDGLVAFWCLMRYRFLD